MFILLDWDWSHKFSVFYRIKKVQVLFEIHKFMYVRFRHFWQFSGPKNSLFWVVFWVKTELYSIFSHETYQKVSVYCPIDLKTGLSYLRYSFFEKSHYIYFSGHFWQKMAISQKHVWIFSGKSTFSGKLKFGMVTLHDVISNF